MIRSRRRVRRATTAAVDHSTSRTSTWTWIRGWSARSSEPTRRTDSKASVRPWSETPMWSGFATPDKGLLPIHLALHVKARDGLAPIARRQLDAWPESIRETTNDDGDLPIHVFLLNTGSRTYNDPDLDAERGPNLPDPRHAVARVPPGTQKGERHVPARPCWLRSRAPRQGAHPNDVTPKRSKRPTGRKCSLLHHGGSRSWPPTVGVGCRCIAPSRTLTTSPMRTLPTPSSPRRRTGRPCSHSACERAVARTRCNFSGPSSIRTLNSFGRRTESPSRGRGQLLRSALTRGLGWGSFSASRTLARGAVSGIHPRRHTARAPSSPPLHEAYKVPLRGLSPLRDSIPRGKGTIVRLRAVEMARRR